MLRHLLSFAPLFLLAADKETGGGQKALTVPELAQKVKDLEAEKQALETKVTEANTAKDAAVAAQQQAEKELAEASTARDAAVAAQQKAEKERDEANTAKAAAAAAEQKASERAAANGHPPVHTEAAKTEANAKDGAALYAEYKTLKGREKAAFYKQHEKALDAYAKEQARAGN